ncbi:succinate dehydrogenase cytochrome b subunit [Cutibacterium acnes JCM 18920]|nr:succinate dehydrogenase cytochrome b subunit [Cutibacterium acnes JCM 18920]
MIMAITGTIFALFVFVHMVGNLKPLWGQETTTLTPSFSEPCCTRYFPLVGFCGASGLFYSCA